MGKINPIIRLGLLHVTRISLAVQYKTIQFILLILRMDGSTTSCTVWDSLRLSSCQVIKMPSVWISSWLSMANFMESNRQKIFSFSTFDFYGLTNLYTKSFSLWRRHTFYHRSSSILTLYNDLIFYLINENTRVPLCGRISIMLKHNLLT